LLYLGLPVAWVTYRYTTGDYYYHKTKNEMVERNWRLGSDMVWVLVGVIGYVPQPWGIAWLHCFSVHVN
jgi:hypothetical protein